MHASNLVAHAMMLSVLLHLSLLCVCECVCCTSQCIHASWTKVDLATFANMEQTILVVTKSFIFGEVQEVAWFCEFASIVQ